MADVGGGDGAGGAPVGSSIDQWSGFTPPPIGKGGGGDSPTPMTYPHRGVVHFRRQRDPKPKHHKAHGGHHAVRLHHAHHSTTHLHHAHHITHPQLHPHKAAHHRWHIPADVENQPF